MSRILVVDDEPDVLMAIRITLESVGHTVLEAANGATALARARENPDGILLDIRLPDIDGLEVLRRLKADAAVSSIPVVCISAHSSPGTVQAAIDLGAAGYVGKPFDVFELRATVADVMSGPPGALD
jgi:two-component system KDP operon response regulator KdpE